MNRLHAGVMCRPRVLMLQTEQNEDDELRLRVVMYVPSGQENVSLSSDWKRISADFFSLLNEQKKSPWTGLFEYIDKVRPTDKSSINQSINPRQRQSLGGGS